jgi:hypothetical protein
VTEHKFCPVCNCVINDRNPLVTCNKCHETGCAHCIASILCDMCMDTEYWNKEDELFDYEGPGDEWSEASI